MARTKKNSDAQPPEMTPQQKAIMALKPCVNGAAVVAAYQAPLLGKDADMSTLIEELRGTFDHVHDGDLQMLERMLVAHATALQTMFASMARRAAHQEQLRHYEVFMGLALKAQSQSRATISALVDLKYPRQATFVKQVNIAHGAQQVNNHGRHRIVLSRARKNCSLSRTNYWSRTMGNPAAGWTTERRQRQREAIRRWKPWLKSSGPKTAEGKAAVARNAYTGGHQAEFRQIVKDMNQVLRRQRDFLR